MAKGRDKKAWKQSEIKVKSIARKTETNRTAAKIVITIFESNIVRTEKIQNTTSKYFYGLDPNSHDITKSKINLTDWRLLYQNCIKNYKNNRKTLRK